MTLATTHLLQIRGLSTDYITGGGILRRRRGTIRAIDQLDLDVARGETLSVVGESGCGKTTLALTILLLIRPSAGEISFNGRDILALDRAGLRDIRREMQILFQNPFTSLNPRMPVLDLIAEPFLSGTRLRGKALEREVARLLGEVGMSEEHLRRLPHQLSGGQAQRVALARALALNPKLLILDEPTSALDVSVQAQVINLLESLRQLHGLTYLFITHDLSLVHHISERVAVMYLGQIVEMAPCEDIFLEPLHPYTRALLSSTPIPDPDRNRSRIVLRGTIPSPANPPSGCRFHTRCPAVIDICKEMPPGPTTVGGEHWAKCHLLSA